MRIRIWILVKLKSQKFEFLHVKFKCVLIGLKPIFEGTKALLNSRKPDLLILVNFHVLGSGSALLIRIRIQDSQINADLQHCF
jgi:hypothetical protein